MFVPINSLRYLKKNFAIIIRDYNWLNFSVCFILIPIVLSFIVSSFAEVNKVISMLTNTINFFSITIGFLINALVFILLDKTEPKLKEQKDANLEKIENLKSSLCYNILGSIIFSICFLILILFYPVYPMYSILIKGITLHPIEFFLLLLFIESLICLLNILRKMGSYVETKYNHLSTSS